MGDPTFERVPLADLVQDPANPRARTDRGRATIAHSLRTFGPLRSGVLTGKQIVAGNGTAEAALAIGVTDAIIIDPPPNTMVFVRGKLTKSQARAYSVMDNQSTDLSVFVDEPLLDAFDELVEDDYPLLDTGFTSDEIDRFVAGDTDASGVPRDEPEGEDVSPEDLFRAWPSDNPWGVPTLRLDMQAESADGPWLKWGTRRRGADFPGVHFYTDDFKFWGLNRNPQNVVATGCAMACEPNYSTWPEMARAEFLWWTYSKRIVARWWQEHGVRVLVDLNTDGAFDDLALLGVPEGWRAYATRWHKGNDEESMLLDHRKACARAGSDDVLFVVFGGGQRPRRMCEEQEWAYVPEEADTSRGRA